MRYTQDVHACLAETVGAHGLDRARLDALTADLAPAVERLRVWQADGSLPLLRLPDRRDDLAPMQAVAERCRARFADVVVLGTGGSSLGGRSLTVLADAGWGPRPGAPRLHFMDNVDPHSFQALFAALDPARTGVLAVSKSGSTAETMLQLAVALAWLRSALGEAALARHVVAVTEPTDNPLARIARRFGIEILEHDPKVGGRYSVLSVTGMLPAMIAGMDAPAVRAGAGEVLKSVLDASKPAEAAPAVGAALAVGFARDKGAPMSVLMPYVDRLAPFARWYRQLWAESLGKGGNGTTPVDAIGTIDQHSQLQLYLDGPADKLFTLVMGPMAGAGEPADSALMNDPALGYLQGRTLGDLMDACQRATAETLTARGRPVRVMTLATVDEASLGALMMHFMLETILAAHLLGVDPFDQPAVEEGKVLARRHLDAMRGRQ
ncbi:MAG: glucose-6-phosphate isomerase [Alphaproteobacteria bacterium]